MQTTWAELRPALSSKSSIEIFVAHVRALARLQSKGDGSALDELRNSFIEGITCSRRNDNQILLAAGLVVTDLAVQGWRFRVRGKVAAVRPPEEHLQDRSAEKARIRRQELVKRD